MGSIRHKLRHLLGTGLLTVVCFGLISSVLQAHDGPPFPVVMEEPVDDFLISVWADPDVGESQFFVVLEQRTDQTSKRDIASLPTIAVTVEPKHHRYPKVAYQAVREDLRNTVQFVAEPYLSEQTHYVIEVLVTGLDDLSEKIIFEVEATPPGLGPVDLVIYLLPFILFGGLWGMGFAKRRRVSSSAPENSSQHNDVSDLIAESTRQA